MQRYPGVSLDDQRAHLEAVLEDARRDRRHPDPDIREPAEDAIPDLESELAKIEEALRLEHQPHGGS